MHLLFGTELLTCGCMHSEHASCIQMCSGSSKDSISNIHNIRTYTCCLYRHICILYHLETLMVDAARAVRSHLNRSTHTLSLGILSVHGHTSTGNEVHTTILKGKCVCVIQMDESSPAQHTHTHTTYTYTCTHTGYKTHPLTCTQCTKLQHLWCAHLYIQYLL